jgi:hypothetical protein
MTEDGIIGLQVKALTNEGTRLAVQQVSKAALGAVREHRDLDPFDRANDPGFDTGGDDFSGF